MTTKHTPTHCAIKGRATPTPWKLYTGRLRPQFPTDVIEIRGRSRYPVVSWSGFDERAVPKNRYLADAAFIVQAVNSYEAMRKALRAACSVLPAITSLPNTQTQMGDVLAEIEAALALTEEAPNA